MCRNGTENGRILWPFPAPRGCVKSKGYEMSRWRVNGRGIAPPGYTFSIVSFTGLKVRRFWYKWKMLHPMMIGGSNMSDYEKARQTIVVSVGESVRAKALARALSCHPAVPLFPGWDIEHESAA